MLLWLLLLDVRQDVLFCNDNRAPSFSEGHTWQLECMEAALLACVADANFAICGIVTECVSLSSITKCIVLGVACGNRHFA